MPVAYGCALERQQYKKHCEKYAEIEQGEEKTSKIAKQIQYKIGGELDDIVRALPAGGCEVKG